MPACATNHTAAFWHWLSVRPMYTSSGLSSLYFVPALLVPLKCHALPAVPLWGPVLEGPGSTALRTPQGGRCHQALGQSGSPAGSSFSPAVGAGTAPPNFSCPSRGVLPFFPGEDRLFGVLRSRGCETPYGFPQVLCLVGLSPPACALHLERTHCLPGSVVNGHGGVWFVV